MPSNGELRGKGRGFVYKIVTRALLPAAAAAALFLLLRPEPEQPPEQPSDAQLIQEMLLADEEMLVPDANDWWAERRMIIAIVDKQTKVADWIITSTKEEKSHSRHYFTDRRDRMVIHLNIFSRPTAAVLTYLLCCSCSSAPVKPLTYTEQKIGEVRYIENLEPFYTGEDEPLSLEFVQKYGELESENENLLLSRPDGVTVDGEGNVFIADTWNHRVQKFDRQGNFLLSFGRRGEGPTDLL